MFLKQYNYKPRSNSQSSGTSDTNINSNSTTTNQQAASPTDANNANQQGRRRSSVTEKFAGLNSMKRGSVDASFDAKKASFLEQKPGTTGILGGMWQNFTKGTN